jgi:hypothetical protein
MWAMIPMFRIARIRRSAAAAPAPLIAPSSAAPLAAPSGEYTPRDRRRRVGAPPGDLAGRRRVAAGPAP